MIIIIGAMIMITIIIMRRCKLGRVLEGRQWVAPSS